MDAVLDITFPPEPSVDFDINALVAEIVDNIATGSTETATERIPGHRELAKPALTAPTEPNETRDPLQQVGIDIDLRFRDLKAQVPVFTTELGYTKNALIRPIVAFIK